MDDRVAVMIACLSRVAWADGKLLPAEAEFFRKVIDSLDMSDDCEKQAWRAVASPPRVISPAQVALLSAEDREQVLALSRDMADCDSDISDEERDVIAQLEDLFAQ